MPILFCLAGAAGGALEALLSQVLVGDFGNEAEDLAILFGGVGLLIGLAMCLSRKAWVATALSPVLGVGWAVAVATAFHGAGSPLSILKLLTETEPVWLLTVPGIPILVLAHHGYLHAMKRGWTAAVGLAIYGTAGALSQVLVWNRVETIGAGLVNGALFGFLQHIAMMAALGVEKWRAESESGSTS